MNRNDRMRWLSLVLVCALAAGAAMCVHAEGVVAEATTWTAPPDHGANDPEWRGYWSVPGERGGVR